MDQCTHEVRAEYWKKIIQACGQRPAGQSAKSWMDENGISEQSYYHWQRRFRKQAYEEMKGNSSVPAVTEKTELSFVEIPCHTSAETNTYMVSDKPVATIRTATLQIDISNEISDVLLSRIIQERCPMLEDAAGIRRVVLACGTVDLRKGIDGLATIIGDKYGQNPFEKGTLFLFCGKRSDRCKGLLWMGTGFLLLYKRFEAGRLSWPRNIQEAADLTEEQYKYLMMGLNPLDPKIKDVDPKNIY